MASLLQASIDEKEDASNMELAETQTTLLSIKAMQMSPGDLKIPQDVGSSEG